MEESSYHQPSNYFAALFTSLGKKYETLVFEISRRSNVVAQRQALKLPEQHDEERDASLAAELKLTERLLAVLAEDRSK